jgi:hypothetical protein
MVGGRAATTSGRARRQEIELELTPAQISQVIRTMADGENRSRSVVLSGLADARRLIAADRGRLADPHMCRALRTGMMMLAAFPADGSYMSNAEVARALGLNRSTSHRYLVTLQALGFLERDPTTRKLRLAL